MSELRRFVHNKNLQKNIHCDVLLKINNKINTLNFETLLNIFCEYKINYNENIYIYEYKYHIIDMIYPKSLRNVIIDNYLIFQIKNQLNNIFGHDTVILGYSLTEYGNNIIVSYYLSFNYLNNNLDFQVIS